MSKFDYYAVQNHQNIWRASSSGCFTALLIIGGGGGGGGLVLLSFYACHLCVSLIVAILNFR